MAVQGTQDPGGEEPSGPFISALTASPERTVFTEEGNNDGWIATDLTVDLLR
jgi:hypothetical protein